MARQRTLADVLAPMGDIFNAAAGLSGAVMGTVERQRKLVLDTDLFQAENSFRHMSDKIAADAVNFQNRPGEYEDYKNSEIAKWREGWEKSDAPYYARGLDQIQGRGRLALDEAAYRNGLNAQRQEAMAADERFLAELADEAQGMAKADPAAAAAWYLAESERQREKANGAGLHNPKTYAEAGLKALEGAAALEMSWTGNYPNIAGYYRKVDAAERKYDGLGLPNAHALAEAHRQEGRKRHAAERFSYWNDIDAEYRRYLKDGKAEQAQYLHNKHSKELFQDIFNRGEYEWTDAQVNGLEGMLGFMEPKPAPGGEATAKQEVANIMQMLVDKVVRGWNDPRTGAVSLQSLRENAVPMVWGELTEEQKKRFGGSQFEFEKAFYKELFSDWHKYIKNHDDNNPGTPYSLDTESVGKIQSMLTNIKAKDALDWLVQSLDNYRQNMAFGEGSPEEFNGYLDRLKAVLASSNLKGAAANARTSNPDSMARFVKELEGNDAVNLNTDGQVIVPPGLRGDYGQYIAAAEQLLAGFAREQLKLIGEPKLIRDEGSDKDGRGEVSGVGVFGVVGKPGVSVKLGWKDVDGKTKLTYKIRRARIENGKAVGQGEWEEKEFGERALHLTEIRQQQAEDNRALNDLMPHLAGERGKAPKDISKAQWDMMSVDAKRAQAEYHLRDMANPGIPSQVWVNLKTAEQKRTAILKYFRGEL